MYTQPVGPPWQYIPPAYLYGFVGIAGLIISVLLIVSLFLFIKGFFQHRHEVKIARIQSGNLDPMQTQAGSFLIFRRGVVLIFVGFNFAIMPLFDSPAPLIFLPFTLGIAYLAIYFIHERGLLNLFPINGANSESVSRVPEQNEGDRK